MDGKWWCGFSGGAIMPDESGIQGVEVKHVRIVAGSPAFYYQRRDSVNLSVGSAMTFKGESDVRRSAKRRQIPRTPRWTHSECTHAFAGLPLPMHFTLGAQPESGLYWKASGGGSWMKELLSRLNFIFSAVSLAQAGILQITGYDCRRYWCQWRERSRFPITQVKIRPQLKAGLLFYLSNHRLFRFAATANLESTGAGTLGTVSDVSGTMSILPSRSARGNVFGQFSMATRKAKTISLSRHDTRVDDGNEFENQTSYCFTASESKILIGNITKMDGTHARCRRRTDTLPAMTSAAPLLLNLKMRRS